MWLLLGHADCAHNSSVIDLQCLNHFYEIRWHFIIVGTHQRVLLGWGGRVTWGAINLALGWLTWGLIWVGVSSWTVSLLLISAASASPTSPTCTTTSTSVAVAGLLGRCVVCWWWSDWAPHGRHERKRRNVRHHVPITWWRGSCGGGHHDRRRWSREANRVVIHLNFTANWLLQQSGQMWSHFQWHYQMKSKTVVELLMLC
jgi:hypothetical protein